VKLDDCKEIDYIESGDKINDYVMNTCSIVSEFSELNDKINGSSEEELAIIIDRKHILVEEYCSIMGINSIQYTNNIHSVCKRCDSVDLDVREGFTVCMKCGVSVSVIDTHSTPSFKEAQERNYKPVFTYKRVLISMII